ncbi:unnamed protein product [Ostreobium quekettii]|uniref:amino-acid N-acetyltransferase n=1 Tax=Ostreobium quekettii TaxID=121088 RepID=A0A8S1IXA2_9CHLO|nr:unnamed protein product [Ostreobium quekettii]|eukprot:evm.model.scf_87.4 EVM.evm.TU.scf_87.4   scf_87:34282-43140(+)
MPEAPPLAAIGFGGSVPCGRPGRRARRAGKGPGGKVRRPLVRERIAGSGGGAIGGRNGELSREDYGRFVQHFRQASPYIIGHHGSTFVVVIPGEVVEESELLERLLEDLALLHALGVRLVVVVGTQCLTDKTLRARGLPPRYANGLRITDAEALQAAVEAAGRTRAKVEGYLSKTASVPMMRRHTKGDGEVHPPGLRVVGGNYVTAKRLGIVDGVDFEFTGEVRSVLCSDIKQQLDSRNIVLLTSIGYSPSGQVLNCNVYDVGLHSAVGLDADKICCVHLGDIDKLNLRPWVPLSDAYEFIDGKPEAAGEGSGGLQGVSRSNGRCQRINAYLEKPVNPELPRSVLACILACHEGVNRSHLVDAKVDGGLLLELYTRDGLGTMISTDFYQGIRQARAGDLPLIHELLRPLQAAGVILQRSFEQLAAEASSFRVFEQEGRILACACASDLGFSSDGVQVVELGAFCVHPANRSQGLGDSLLDYIEQEIRDTKRRRLVLLTTRTADWFVQRGFLWVGPAHASDLLPVKRRCMVAPSRNSQLYVKDILPISPSEAPAGKRVGF